MCRKRQQQASAERRAHTGRLRQASTMSSREPGQTQELLQSIALACCVAGCSCDVCIPLTLCRLRKRSPASSSADKMSTEFFSIDQFLFGVSIWSPIFGAAFGVPSLWALPAEISHRSEHTRNCRIVGKCPGRNQRLLLTTVGCGKRKCCRISAGGKNQEMMGLL